MLRRTREKKLAVRKETLRHLASDQLALVAGGAPRGTSRCSHTDDWTADCDGGGNGPKKP